VSVKKLTRTSHRVMNIDRTEAAKKHRGSQTPEVSESLGKAAEA